MKAANTAHPLPQVLQSDLRIDLDLGARIALATIDVPDFNSLAIVRERAGSGVRESARVREKQAGREKHAGGRVSGRVFRLTKRGARLKRYFMHSVFAPPIWSPSRMKEIGLTR